MTDVRAQLTDALREHQLGFAEPDGGFCCASIHCDWIGHNYDFEDHQADVLLALPNIATVALPEPAISQDTYQSWIVSLDGEQEYVTAPAADDEVAISGIGRFIPSEARVLAAALLAAANAAEQAAK